MLPQNYDVEQTSQAPSTTGAWVWLIAAVAYTLSPIDIIPDIPIVGWVDDFFILATSGLNMLEKQLGGISAGLAGIAKVLKYILIVLGVISILLVGLLGAAIVKLFTN